MQKKLLTAAVSLALAAPAAAFAQATLYGIVDVGYQNVSGYAPGDSNSAAVMHNGQKSSRLGARVSEDLGGGLSARAVIEFDITSDTGATSAAGMTQRQTLVALDSKSWGELVLGRQLTHIFTSVAMVEGASGVNGFQSMYGMTDTQTRSSNYIKYASPNFQGFTFGAGWAPGEDATPVTNDGNNDFWDVALRYEAGNFGAVWGYSQIESVTGAVAATTAVNLVTGVVAPVAAVAARDFKEKDNAIAGYFNFNPFKILALYKTSKQTGTGAAEDLKIYTLRGEFKTGPGTVAVSFGKSKNELAAAAGMGDADFFGLAYYHDLSKRTTAYAQYGRIKNDPGANFALGGQQFANTAGSDPKGFSVGINHSF